MSKESLDSSILADTCGGWTQSHGPKPTSRAQHTGGDHGGVYVKLTQFGYRNDPYGDSETRKGHGAFSPLQADRSVAMTDSAREALGISRKMASTQHPWVDIRLPNGGMMTRRLDDRAPEADRRVDVYQPRGFDSRLPTHAYVSLHRS